MQHKIHTITQDCLPGDHGKFFSRMTPAGKSKVCPRAVLQDRGASCKDYLPRLPVNLSVLGMVWWVSTNVAVKVKQCKLLNSVKHYETSQTPAEFFRVDCAFDKIVTQYQFNCTNLFLSCISRNLSLRRQSFAAWIYIVSCKHRDKGCFSSSGNTLDKVAVKNSITGVSSTCCFIKYITPSVFTATGRFFFLAFESLILSRKILAISSTRKIIFSLFSNFS